MQEQTNFQLKSRCLAIEKQLINLKQFNCYLNEINEVLFICENINGFSLNELNKILVNKNYEKGLNLLKRFDLLGIIGIQYNKLVYVEDLCGMWSQIDITNDIPFTKEEKNNISKIKEILELGYIDNYIIYKYGLYISSVAAKILELDINVVEIYDNLPIKHNKDLEINILEIKELIHKEFEEAKKLQEEIIKKIVNNKLNNNHEDIVKFIKQGMI